MESKNLEKDLVCVLFPGIVKNDEKALQCLGGVRGLSNVYSNPNKKRLGLSYQPENPFVKKIYANSKRTAGVLLKIKVKKTTVNDEIKREVVSTSVVGRVKTMFKFESMCDFQYLPVHREGAGDAPPKCMLDSILPAGVDTFDFLSKPAPFLLVPANFSRFDKPTSYAYTDKRYLNRALLSPERDDNVHNKTRALRGVQLAPYFFNLTDNLPTEPNEIYIKQKDFKLTIYPKLNDEFETIKKLFEERPIWSLNVIRYRTKVRLISLKIILPCLAIYMKTGPWRTMWVKYGYDPRKEPGSRIYQTLDFRLRHAAGIRSMVTPRDEVVHYKKADRVWHITKKDSDDATSSEDVAEGSVCFRPGITPTQRHIFYQYCDVKVPEVEEILAADPPSGYLCHEKRGWLPPNTDEICRDHIFRYTKETLLSTHNAELKLEQGSGSEEDSNSDEDEQTNEADDS